mgnify:CR=1 FL=1
MYVYISEVGLHLGTRGLWAHHATLFPYALRMEFQSINYASIFTNIIKTKMLWIGQRTSIEDKKRNSDMSI